MNNKNWVAVFLGLACLALLVSVMGASGSWLNNTTNSTTPQQVNQTLKDTNNNMQNSNILPKIDTNQITNDMQDKNNNNDTKIISQQSNNL